MSDKEKQYRVSSEEKKRNTRKKIADREIVSSPGKKDERFTH